MGFFSKAADAGKDMIKGYDKVKLANKMSYQELFDVIKEGTYSVGEPILTGKGIMQGIQFPEIDKYLIQVGIAGKTVTICKVYSGIGGMLKESVGDALTNGWYNTINKENIDLNRATRDIGEEISRLLEQKGLLAK